MVSTVFRAMLVLSLVPLLLSACIEDRFFKRKPSTHILEEVVAPSTISDDPKATTTTVIGENSATPNTPPVTEPAQQISPFEIIGSGDFATDYSQASESSVGASGYSLDFVEADVRDVIHEVLGNVLGKNYFIDPAVNGPVTLVTNDPMTKGQVLSMLEAVLNANSLVLVQDNNLIRVIPASKAKGLGSKTIGSDGGTNNQGFGLSVMAIKHISTDEILQLLEPMTPEGVSVNSDSQKNLLFIQGTQSQRDDLSDLIRSFDVDWFSGMSFAMVPLSYSNAQELSLELENILSADRGGPLGTLVHILPNDRLNAILIISSRPNYIPRVRQWVERLDIGTESNKQRLYVYQVQNGRAAELAPVLSELFDVAVSKTGDSSQSSPVAPGETAVSLSTGSQDTGSSSSEASTPQTSNASWDSGPSSLSSSGNNSGLSEGDIGNPTIIADDTRNALLIRATPDQFASLKEAIDQLDILPIQVLIEATIAEVGLDDELKYGVEYFFNSGNHTGSFSDVTSGAVASNFPGFSYLFSGSANSKVVINALSSVTDVTVLSSPHLMVLDNRTAKLQIGDQVPVATQSSVSNTDPNAPTVNTIEFRDTGVVLEVTPRVNASGIVNLEIEQEVSDVVSTTTSGIDSPTIQQRKVSSQVVVKSGESIILGGMIRDIQTDKESGLPILSNIPVLGKLFGNTDNDHKRTELLIIITPRVVRNSVDARDVTNEFKRRLKEVISKNSDATEPPQ